MVIFIAGDAGGLVTILAPLWHSLEAKTTCRASHGMVEYYVKFYRSERELKESIKDYINFYNSFRIHTYNHNKTPDEKEALFYSQNQAE